MKQTSDGRRAQRRKLHEKYGPWAVVTGASDGIGREFAGRLAAEGFALVLVARRGAVLAEVGRELGSRHGVEVLTVAADLATAAGVAAVRAETAGLDIGLLVAAAGFGTSGRFVDAPLAEELAMIDVNCRAVAELAHHFGAAFVRRGRGGMVLMSSLLAFQGVPRAANYAATKAFVQSLAEGLRAELAPLGVDVIASAPGPIHSGFGSRARMTMSLAQGPAAVAQATLDALGSRNTVRPGWLSKALAWSLATLPRWARVRVMAVVMAGMARETLPRSGGQAASARG